MRYSWWFTRIRFLASRICRNFSVAVSASAVPALVRCATKLAIFFTEFRPSHICQTSRPVVSSSKVRLASAENGRASSSARRLDRHGQFRFVPSTDSVQNRRLPCERFRSERFISETVIRFRLSQTSFFVTTGFQPVEHFHGLYASVPENPLINMATETQTSR